MRNPYPLQWPPGMPRTTYRTHPKFGSHFSKDRDSVIWQLKKRGASQIVITSALPVRRDGLPYAATGAEDPGIAVWFVRKGKEGVIACDNWIRVADNLRAIDKSLEALRGLDRWGCAQIVEQAFAGFAALPPGDDPGGPALPVVRPWREVLGGFPAGLDDDDLFALAKARHRKLISEAHPDLGGDPARAAEINAAFDAATAELVRPAEVTL